MTDYHIFLNPLPRPCLPVCASCGRVLVDAEGRLCDDAFYQCASQSAVYAAKWRGIVWAR